MANILVYRGKISGFSPRKLLGTQLIVDLGRICYYISGLHQSMGGGGGGGWDSMPNGPRKNTLDLRKLLQAICSN